MGEPKTGGSFTTHCWICHMMDDSLYLFHTLLMGMRMNRTYLDQHGRLSHFKTCVAFLSVRTQEYTENYILKNLMIKKFGVRAASRQHYIFEPNEYESDIKTNEIMRSVWHVDESTGEHQWSNGWRKLGGHRMDAELKLNLKSRWWWVRQFPSPQTTHLAGSVGWWWGSCVLSAPWRQSGGDQTPPRSPPWLGRTWLSAAPSSLTPAPAHICEARFLFTFFFTARGSSRKKKIIIIKSPRPRHYSEQRKMEWKDRSEVTYFLHLYFTEYFNCRDKRWEGICTR